MTALTTLGLRLGFGERTVLHDLSCRVAAGEFFIVIGPNGSGKTTLLKAIAGLVSPRAGRIELFGRPLSGYSRRELARILAVVPQRPPDNFPFIVRDTVLMGRSPHLPLLSLEGPHDHELALEAMRFTEVAHLAERHLDQLSGGELQRVIIARALCQEPRLLVLDEPTASLDLAHQVRIMDLLARLRRQRGTTVVLVSHDLNLAAAYGDRLLLLHDGRVAALGPPAEVLRRELLEPVYGCRLIVERGEPDNMLRVLPLPARHV